MEKFNYKGQEVYLCVVVDFTERPVVKAVPVEWFEKNKMNLLVSGRDGIDGDSFSETLTSELYRFESIDTTFFTFT